MSKILEQAIVEANGTFHQLTTNASYVAKLARAMKEAGEVADCLAGQAMVKEAGLKALAASNAASVAFRAERAVTRRAAAKKMPACKVDTNELVALAPAAWESEKAVGIDVTVYQNSGEFSRAVGKQRVFIAKSQIHDGKAPLWLVRRASEEALVKFAGEGHVAGFSIGGVAA